MFSKEPTYFFLFLLFSFACCFHSLSVSNWAKGELFFGLSIQTEVNGTLQDGVISYEEFDSFIDEYITPVFPDGLTYLNASGQWLSQSGNLVVEPSIYMIIYYENNADNEENIQQIVQSYMDLYQQEAVLYTSMVSTVCTTPQDCLSEQQTYHSTLSILALCLALFNTFLIILVVFVLYRSKKKRYSIKD